MVAKQVKPGKFLENFRCDPGLNSVTHNRSLLASALGNPGYLDIFLTDANSFGKYIGVILPYYTKITPNLLLVY